MSYDLLSLGSAVVDKILCVDESFLEKMHFNKGGTRVHLNVDHSLILDQCPSKNMLSIPGGSAANTTKVVAGLGLKCAYIAKVGKDKWGEFYRSSFIERGITPFFSECEKLPTGSLLCMITPDGERTMCPDLRACQSITGLDIKESYFENVRLFHMDGYNFYYPDALEESIRLAAKMKCSISIDMSSFELMKSHAPRIQELLDKRTFDLIFANEREAFELTGATDPVRACEKLSIYCPLVTVMMGERGSATIHNGQLYLKPTKAIKPLDTTGAGDMYIGGFLFGYLSGYSIDKCMSLGTTTAVKGIQVFGGELPMKYLLQLKESLKTPELVNV